MRTRPILSASALIPSVRTLRAVLGAAALTLALGAGGALADAQRSQRFYDDAMRKLEAGDVPAAVIQLRNALQQDATNREARLMLGRVYLRTGDAAGAERELRRAFEAEPSDQVQLMLAQALMMQGKFADVFRVITPEAETADMVNRKLIVRGQAYMGLGQFDDAETMFEAAATSPPALPEAQIGLARVDIARGRLDAADKRLAELANAHPDHLEALLLRADVAYALRRANEALAMLNQANSVAPDDPRVLLPRARIRLETGAVDEAEKDVTRILERAPQDVMGRYMRAAIQLMRGDAAAANQTFMTVEQSLIDFIPAQLLKGMIKTETGELAQAEAALARFTTAVPQHVPAHRLLAAVHLKADNPLAAVEVLEPVLARVPDDQLARQLLAGAYMRLGRYDDAAEAYRRLAEARDGRTATMARGALALLDMAGTAESEDSRALSPEARRTALLVLEYVRTGEFERAHRAVDDLRAANPDNPLLINLEAGVHMAEGDLNAARSRLEEAQRIDPTVAAVLDNLNAVDARLGNLGAIEERLREAVEEAPYDEAPVLRLAQFLIQNDRAGEAAQVVTAAVERRPTSLPLRRAAAEIYERQGDTAGMVRVAEGLLALGGEQPDALLLAGTLFRTLQDHDRAAEALGRFVQARPDPVEPRLMLAQSLIAAGRPDEARTELEAIKAREPANVPATLGLIDLALAEGDEGKALALADALQKEAPAAAAQLRASILLRTNRPDQAVDTLAAALDQHPGTGLALDLFDLRRRLGRADEAVDGLKTYVDRQPEDARARLALADALLARNDHEQSAAHYQQLLEREPGNAALLNNLAWLKQEMGSPEALQYARRAHAAAPQSAEVADTLGWILVQAGETGEGLELLRQAAAGAPNNPDIQYHLAYTLNTTGQREQAKVILERLAQEERPFMQKQAAAELLASLEE